MVDYDWALNDVTCGAAGALNPFLDCHPCAERGTHPARRLEAPQFFVRDAELIVVDGGSTDDLWKSQVLCDRVEAPAGRARQMNEGAGTQVASGYFSM